MKGWKLQAWDPGVAGEDSMREAQHLGVARGQSPCFSDSKWPDMAPGDSAANVTREHQAMERGDKAGSRSGRPYGAALPSMVAGMDRLRRGKWPAQEHSLGAQHHQDKQPSFLLWKAAQPWGSLERSPQRRNTCAVRSLGRGLTHVW